MKYAKYRIVVVVEQWQRQPNGKWSKKKVDERSYEEAQKVFADRLYERFSKQIRPR